MYLGEYIKKWHPPLLTYLRQEGFYQFQELIKKYPPNPPKIDINPKEDIAILPYTGGTTGHPKGVMITHYNLLLSDMQFHAFYPIFEEGKEVLLGYMPFYHAAGQLQAVKGIIHGYTIGDNYHS